MQDGKMEGTNPQEQDAAASGVSQRVGTTQNPPKTAIRKVVGQDNNGNPLFDEIRGLVGTLRNFYRKTDPATGQVKIVRAYRVTGSPTAVQAYIEAQGDNVRFENNDGKTPLYFTSIVTPGANFKRLNLVITPNNRVVEDNLDALMQREMQKEIFYDQETAKMRAKAAFGFGTVGMAATTESSIEAGIEHDLDVPVG